MTDLRKAAQQALGYMKSIGQMDMYPEDWAIVGRLEAALAQQAEPRNQCGETCERARLCATCAQALAQQDEPKPMSPEQRQRWEELAAMPQQAEPLNLTDPAVQKRLAAQWGYVPAALAEPVEPVAWADKISFEDAMKTGKGHDVWPKAGDYETRTGRALIGLYTAPPQRKPLTEEEILKAIGWERAEMYMKLATNFPVDEAKQETLKNARAVERAVWEKNHG